MDAASSLPSLYAGTIIGTIIMSLNPNGAPAGFYSQAGATAYLIDPAGTYSPPAASAPTTDPAGTDGGAGASAPTLAAAGAYIPITGATSAAAEIDDPAGAYSPAGASAATTDPAGTYSGPGASAPTLAAAGTHIRVTGATSGAVEIVDPAGTYSNAGASAPTTDPAGTYSPPGASAPTTDPAGTSSGAGASAPTPAAAGTYIFDPAASQYGLDRLFLSNSNFIPFNTVLSFNSVTAVENFFGVDSNEAKLATEFFSGYNGPWANMLFDRMPLGGGRARIYGANLSGLTLTQLKAIKGRLSLTSEGYNFDASINLASATSFASAASLIQAALNAAQPTEATTTGSSIAPASASFTGSIEGGLMVVTAVSNGQIAIGGTLTDAIGYSHGQIIAQISGAPGGVGVYNVWWGATG